MGHGLPLVALLDRCVVVEGGVRDLHLASDFERERDVDASQPLERARLRRDVGDIAGRPAALRLVDELVVVEGVEKGPEDILRGELGSDQALKALIRAQHVDVAEAVATAGHQQHEGFGLGAVGCTVVALTDTELRIEHGAYAELAHRLDNERKSRVRRYSVGVVDDFDRVREEPRLARHNRYLCTNACRYARVISTDECQHRGRRCRRHLSTGRRTTIVGREGGVPVPVGRQRSKMSPGG